MDRRGLEAQGKSGTKTRFSTDNEYPPRNLSAEQEGQEWWEYEVNRIFAMSVVSDGTRCTGRQRGGYHGEGS